MKWSDEVAWFLDGWLCKMCWETHVQEFLQISKAEWGWEGSTSANKLESRLTHISVGNFLTHEHHRMCTKNGFDGIFPSCFMCTAQKRTRWTPFRDSKSSEKSIKLRPPSLPIFLVVDSIKNEYKIYPGNAAEVKEPKIFHETNIIVVKHCSGRNRKFYGEKIAFEKKNFFILSCYDLIQKKTIF